MMLLEPNEDVLRALHNLNRLENHNYKMLKDWIQAEFAKYVRVAAFGISSQAEHIRVMQGVACTLNEILHYLENAGEELDKRRAGQYPKQ